MLGFCVRVIARERENQKGGSNQMNILAEETRDHGTQSLGYPVTRSPSPFHFDFILSSFQVHSKKELGTYLFSASVWLQFEFSSVSV